MRVNIKSTIGLYPSPLIIVGAMNEEKPTWTLVAHTGILSHDRISISLAKSHFINHLIKEYNKLSINLINQELLAQADYCGMNSGIKVEKSNVFDYEVNSGIPIIKNAPLSMECEVESIVEIGDFENFILKVNCTYTEETNLNSEGELDIQKVNPVLFSMTSYEYLTLGEKKFKCLTLGQNIKKDGK